MTRPRLVLDVDGVVNLADVDAADAAARGLRQTRHEFAVLAAFWSTGSTDDAPAPG